MTTLTFPIEPALNQEFVGDNDVTYIWMGDRWSSRQAVVTGQAKYIINGSYAVLEDPKEIFDAHPLDGGTATS